MGRKRRSTRKPRTHIRISNMDSQPNPNEYTPEDLEDLDDLGGLEAEDLSKDGDEDEGKGGKNEDKNKDDKKDGQDSTDGKDSESDSKGDEDDISPRSARAIMDGDGEAENDEDGSIPNMDPSKLAKVARGASMAGSGAKVGLLAMGIAKLVSTAKAIGAMIMGVLAKIGAFFSSIFSAISGFISGVLGVAVIVGQIVAVGIIAGTVGLLVAGAVMVVSIIKVDEGLVCNPQYDSVPAFTQEYLEEGQYDVIRQENAKKLWSVYSMLGASKEQTAAVLGNLEAESGVDPTTVETIYGEPFQVGPVTERAWKEYDFLMEKINYSYWATPHYNITYAGTGLGQWTNGRQRLLMNYSNETGMPWYEFDTQIMFMLEGDDDWRIDQLMDFITKEDKDNVEQEAFNFMTGWIGLQPNNDSATRRKNSAVKYMFVLEEAEVDEAYANSILEQINMDRAQGNHSAGAYYWDDGCGNPIIGNYRNKQIDGTGEVPAGLNLVPWTHYSLPRELKKYAVDPREAGLSYGSSSGWASGIIPGQCAAFGTSYFMQLYPDWNKSGRATSRPTGDGGVLAENWANHYGQSVSSTPSSGAIFSDKTTSSYGHTGIVQHVFANGDILIIEENIRGASGANNGQAYSWSWRVIKQSSYIDKNWVFFKPIGVIPKWSK